MLDIQKVRDAILIGNTRYEKAKAKAEFEWSKPIAEDMLLLLLAGVKKDAMMMPGMPGEGGNYGEG